MNMFIMSAQILFENMLQFCVKCVALFHVMLTSQTHSSKNKLNRFFSNVNQTFFIRFAQRTFSIKNSLMSQRVVAKVREYPKYVIGMYFQCQKSHQISLYETVKSTSKCNLTVVFACLSL
jgi:hypothetical protein